MQLTIKNRTANPLSYVQGLITVTANGNKSVPRDFNVLLTQDATFLTDATAGNIIVNNGSTDLSGYSILLLAQVLANFTTDPVATMPLYYQLPINIRQTTNTSVGSVVWAMTNSSSSIKQVIIENINIIMSFDEATPSTRTTLAYELVRFNTVTPTGGTSIIPILIDSLTMTSSVTDARSLDTGLTISGIVFENPLTIITCPACDGSSINYVRNRIPIKLLAGEGLAIRLNADAIEGQSISGDIIWSER